MPKKFHLGWFTNFTVDEWNDPFAAGGGMPWNGRYYVEIAQALERACFDYLMLEDTLMLSDAYGHSTEMEAVASLIACNFRYPPLLRPARPCASRCRIEKKSPS